MTWRSLGAVYSGWPNGEEMKNIRVLGMVAGLIGGGICILGGLLCLFIGLMAAEQGGSTLPPGLYWVMGLYFADKGVFAAGISL